MAMKVVVCPKVIGPLYRFPRVEVGATPFVVYRIETPGVAVLIVTVCAVG
jgi:hypothetical protein